MAIIRRPALVVDNKVHIERSAARFQFQIADLKSLGFTDLGTYYDHGSEWAFLKSFQEIQAFFIMRLMREQVILAWPFTYALICPTFYQSSTGSYSYLCGLGCVVYTERANDNLYVSASWPGNDCEKPDKGFFKRYTGTPTCGMVSEIKEASDNPRSLSWFYSQHMSWVESKSDSLDCPKPASMEDFFRLMDVEGNLYENRLEK